MNEVKCVRLEGTDNTRLLLCRDGDNVELVVCVRHRCLSARVSARALAEGLRCIAPEAYYGDALAALRAALKFLEPQATVYRSLAFQALSEYERGDEAKARDAARYYSKYKWLEAVTRIVYEAIDVLQNPDVYRYEPEEAIEELRRLRDELSGPPNTRKLTEFT